MFQSMLECSMISRSDTSGESGCRGNGSMSLDPANNDPNVQKYACARCGRSYLHQVFFNISSLDVVFRLSCLVRLALDGVTPLLCGKVNILFTS